MLRSALKRQHGRKQRCTLEQLALHMALTRPHHCCEDEYGQTRGMWSLMKLQGQGKHRACNTLQMHLQARTEQQGVWPAPLSGWH